MSERKSNSLESRYAAVLSTNRCLEMIAENRRLEVKALLYHLRSCTGDLAERAATDCDHHGINASNWWKSVKHARKFLKPYGVSSAQK